MWYRLDVGYAVAGIKTKDGVVVNAAPIYRWMVGKKFIVCLEFFTKRGTKWLLIELKGGSCLRNMNIKNCGVGALRRHVTQR